MSVLPMGGCNDPNYGLSDEAAPAPGGRPLQQMRLTEQVGKRNVLRAGCGRGGVGFTPLLSHSKPAPPGLRGLLGADIRISWAGRGRGRSRHTQKIFFKQDQVASS